MFGRIRGAFGLIWFALLVGGVASCGEAVPARAQNAQLDSIQPSGFASLSRELSEPGGYFDTDNLISNESSYLHVMETLRADRLRGGAYIGVGPGQKFSSIAEVRPDVAFIIDIRRDNLLQHLLYKALFAIAPRRIDFVGALVGRDVAHVTDGTDDWSIEQIVEAIDRLERNPARELELVQAVRESVERTGMSLTDSDLETIERFHGSFMRDGLNLRFNTFGRAPRPYYPTLRDLLLERDLAGLRANYLADRDDYVFLRELQRRNLVIPVVGNLAGSHALQAIGAWLDEREVPVTALYTSNVEFYLWGDGSFRRFADNVSSLPRSENSLIIRSYFGTGFRPHPGAISGYVSTQLTQSVNDFVADWQAGRYRTYFDLVWMR